MDFPFSPAMPRDLGVISTLTLAGKANSAHRLVFASAAFPAANRAIFMPFRLSEPRLIRQLFVYNGATASGNLDMGLYDAKGTRIVSKGSTAQSGINALQVLDITDTWLGVGQFYLALAMDGTTATYFRENATIPFMQAMGWAQMAAAFALPATATFATISTSSLPIMGLTTRTVI